MGRDHLKFRAWAAMSILLTGAGLVLFTSFVRMSGILSPLLSLLAFVVTPLLIIIVIQPIYFFITLLLLTVQKISFVSQSLVVLFSSTLCGSLHVFYLDLHPHTLLVRAITITVSGYICYARVTMGDRGIFVFAIVLTHFVRSLMCLWRAMLIPEGLYCLIPVLFSAIALSINEGDEVPSTNRWFDRVLRVYTFMIHFGDEDYVGPHYRLGEAMELMAEFFGLG